MTCGESRRASSDTPTREEWDERNRATAGRPQLRPYFERHRVGQAGVVGVRESLVAAPILCPHFLAHDCGTGMRAPIDGRRHRAKPRRRGARRWRTCAFLRRRDRSRGPCTRMRPGRRACRSRSARARNRRPASRTAGNDRARARQSAANHGRAGASAPGMSRGARAVRGGAPRARARGVARLGRCCKAPSATLD